MTTTHQHYCDACNDFHSDEEMAAWLSPPQTRQGPPTAEQMEFRRRAREAAIEMFGEEPIREPDGEPGPDAAGESYVWPGVEIIHAYTREQALADGALVDVSAVAREAGIRFPVALTRAAWEDCVHWTADDNRRKGTVQDEAGRLWDLLWTARIAMLRGPATDRVRVRLVRTPRGGRVRRAVLVELEAVCGPGDNAEPVITIQQIGED